MALRKPMPISRPRTMVAEIQRPRQNRLMAQLLKGRKKKRDTEQSLFNTRFHEAVRQSPNTLPPCLLKILHRNTLQFPLETNPKIKVSLKISPPSQTGRNSNGSSIISLSPCAKRVTLLHPQLCGYSAPVTKRKPAPKVYAFDHIFDEDESLPGVCSNILPEVLRSVLQGKDACIVNHGQAVKDKKYTMLGTDETCQNFGLIPCSLLWLFKLINAHKVKSNARYSVRVSALQVNDREERISDLLKHPPTTTRCGKESTDSDNEVLLKEDMIYGSQIHNMVEKRVANVEDACFHLDAALENSSHNLTNCDNESNNFLFIIHLYQYQVQKCQQGPPSIAGGRSRLYIADLQSKPVEIAGSRPKLGTAIQVALSQNGNVMQRVQSRKKLCQILSIPLSNPECQVSILAHVSSVMEDYAVTLAVLNFASKIRQTSRTAYQGSNHGMSSDDSSCEELLRSGRFNIDKKLDTLYEGASSDPECTSSSEHSMDTVIYLGENNRRPGSSAKRQKPHKRKLFGHEYRSSGGSSDTSNSTIQGDISRTVTPTDSGISDTQTTDSGEKQSPTQGQFLINAISVNSSSIGAYSTLPRKSVLGLHGSSQQNTGRYSSCQNQKEQWVDGPLDTSLRSIYPERAPEIWIDGPKVFQVSNSIADSKIQHQEVATRHHEKPLRTGGFGPFHRRKQKTKRYHIEHSCSEESQSGGTGSFNIYAEIDRRKAHRKQNQYKSHPAPVGLAEEIPFERTAEWIRKNTLDLANDRERASFVASLKQRLVIVQQEREADASTSATKPVKNSCMETLLDVSSSSSDTGTKNDSDNEVYEHQIDEQLENITPSGTDSLTDDGSNSVASKPSASFPDCTLLRKPDGASNPSLNEEPISTCANCGKHPQLAGLGICLKNCTAAPEWTPSDFSCDEFILATQSAPVTPVLNRRMAFDGFSMGEDRNIVVQNTGLREASPAKLKPKVAPKPQNLSIDLQSKRQVSQLPCTDHHSKNPPLKTAVKGRKGKFTVSQPGNAILNVRPASKSPTIARQQFGRSSLRDSKSTQRESTKLKPSIVVTSASKAKHNADAHSTRTDSDSGVETGSRISSLLSPYNKITNPRPPVTSSSGHGSSDNSSSTEDKHKSRIVMDILNKSRTQHRSRSLPPVAQSAPTSVASSPQIQKRRVSVSGYKARESRKTRYPIPDQTRQTRRGRKINNLLSRQEALKKELCQVKEKILSHSASWGHDLLASEQMSMDDPHYIEALEKETSLLERRVAACKSRILLVTSFDVSAQKMNAETTV